MNITERKRRGKKRPADSVQRMAPSTWASPWRKRNERSGHVGCLDIPYIPDTPDRYPQVDQTDGLLSITPVQLVNL